MDGTGIVIFLIAGGLYLATEYKHHWLLFVAGIGVGIFAAALWLALYLQGL